MFEKDKKIKIFIYMNIYFTPLYMKYMISKHILWINQSFVYTQIDVKTFSLSNNSV